MNRASFLAAVYRIITIYPASVTSWQRTEDRNHRVGGLPNSCHLNGFAVDVVPDHPDHYTEIINAARAEGLDALQHKSHVHIEVDPANQTDG